MTKKHKKVYMVLSYIELVIILVPPITGCALLVGFCIGIESSAVELKMCVTTQELQNISQ